MKIIDRHKDVKSLRAEDIIDTPWEREKFTEERLLEIRKRLIEKMNQKADVNWFNYVFGYIVWYQFKKKVKLDLETIYFILAHFDELEPFMPNKACEVIVQAIDGLGEYLYKKKTKSKE